MKRLSHAFWSITLGAVLGLAFHGCVPTGVRDYEDCDNDADDDGDGQIDCNDTACNGNPSCDEGPGFEDCTNGLDDDEDGLADCDDVLDCGATPDCAAEDCNDGEDDDGDGQIDCDDPDCVAAIGCGTEDCGDGVDNDADGLVDCVDSDCFTDCIPEECTNGADDNGDGLVDCADPDCATTHTDCVDEICDNDLDDDFDALYDCLDEECEGIFPGCIETCTDGIDNDEDGDTDCLDIGDCGLNPVCVETNCTNGLDDELDGMVDCLDSDCLGDPSCTAPGIYELFTSATDLDNHTITFTPSGASYTWAVTTALAFPTSPGTGSPSTAGCTSDDCYTAVSFGTLALTLYGVPYASANVVSNGRITLATPTTTYTESAAGHFTEPNIAALWDDLYLPGGGTLTADRFTDRMVFTWNNVAEYPSTGNFCSAQIQWFTSGVITITHLSCTNPDGLVGISGGNPSMFPLPPAVNFVP